jgi:hypothetical protein
MDDEARGPYTIVPDFILGPLRVDDPDRFSWITPTDVAVYVAARSFTSGDPRSDRYARGYPGAAAVGRRARCSERTARRSIDRWKDHGFLYRKRHRRANAMIVFVDDVDMIPVFEAAQLTHRTRKDEGPLESAKAEHERRLAALKHESWSQSARRAPAIRRGEGQNLDRSRVATQEVLDRPPATRASPRRGEGQNLDRSRVATQEVLDRPPATRASPKTGHPRPQDRPPVTTEQEVVNQTTAREPDSAAATQARPGSFQGKAGQVLGTKKRPVMVAREAIARAHASSR